MVAENINEKGRSQRWPIGDEVNGQVVQAYKALPTKSQDIDWLVAEALTVSTTVVQLTHRLVGYDYAKFVVENADIRFTLDDSTPSATVGWPLTVGDIVTLTGAEEVKDVKFIRKDAADSTLTVMYGRRI